MAKVKLALSAGLEEPFLSRVKELCDITFFGRAYGEAAEGDALLKAGMGQDIVYVAGEVVTREMLEAWQRSGLKLMGCGRGTPVNVDWQAVHDLGIPLVHTPGRNAQSVAEFAMGLLLSLIRRIADNSRALRQGQFLGEAKDIYDVPVERADVVWRMADGTSPMRLFGGGMELYGRTLGLIGYGAIGSKVSHMAQAFGMTVKVYDPYCPEERIKEGGAVPCELDETLSTADVVSIHLPVNPQTRGMVDGSWFKRMKPTAIFLNTARASVVDQQAMIEALESKRIAGAAVDVMWEEPAPANHPMLYMDNVLITTHLAGMSADVESWQSRMIADEIERFANGQQPQLVWTRTK